ncbi:hypothetical protein [Bradyrhizobium japonicum]|uniref:hypothetical protein n=1 Tax=Bradyrhizobium japonicum TaxID=375 RepID=UPI001E30005B|nr:hypothetical protein [Bradyrhizobium japonicum]MCD9257625.1 hypothetical protein [Bradyrhizobium japonicum SEMIA 5079]MCD9818011.1 hypothetical protein [Bradyrhizobium japonicum]MCD9890262.1 hypothetical protein [Bradyrhizobium japonicum]MCD9905540.1 hypothetical protein [Bradyrhizobium japonicum]MCS3983938.1 hypothetical protein [Bradyrhizobium japonicum]
MGDGILHEAIDHRDWIERLHDRRGGGRRPAFLDRLGRLMPAAFIGAPNVQAGDLALGRLVLVDEVDPGARHPREALRVGIAALLRPAEVAPDLMFERAALGQQPLVYRRATIDIGVQPGVEDGPQRLKVGSCDQLLYPPEIVHQPAPRLIEVSGPEADTEEGEPKEVCGLFPQPNLQEIATVTAPGEVGGTSHE